jgi:23S rRNA (uridine2552-2'-O)-methyltransferase
MASKYIRKDRFYKQAKESGYRSRASFKLLEIQKKYKILQSGKKVLDLGCFPGGWLQVAGSICGKKGLIVGIDLKAVEPVLEEGANVHILEGDLLEPETTSMIRLIHSEPFDVILSDMSPHLTGVKFRDQVAAAELFELAVRFCDDFLKKGGDFVAKVFPSEETEEVFRNSRKKWNTFSRTNLESTRGSSNELYVVGRGFKGKLES